MTKAFAASAFRAYAPFDVSDTDLSHAGYTDGPRTNAPLNRWANDIDFGGGLRSQLLGNIGNAWGGHPILSRFTFAEPETVTVSSTSSTTSLELAKTSAPSFSTEAKTIDPGETALLDDIADDNTTTHVLDAQEGDSVHSQIDTPMDQDWFLVELSATNSYKFIMTPDDQSGDPGSPDLLIEIFDASGTLIQTYDSGSFGAAETATFTPGADGTYYVSVRGWTPADIGGYTLTAEINNDGGAGAGTPLAAINWGGDANRVDTGNYDANGAMIIKVYFSQTGDLPYGSPDDPVVGLTWDDFAKEGMYQAFECYENIINVVFQEVATQEEADFILAATATAPVILGRMRPPNEPNEGLGEFNVLASTWTEEGTAQGAYMYITFIHELGHGMGLAHPHDTGGGSEVMSGVSGDLATGYTYGDFGLNQGIWTTMSYNDGWQTAPHGNTDSDDYGYQGTLMALDVAMLQIKYGANTTYNNTDTVYALPTDNLAGTFYSTIWDTGGTDWIIAGAAVDCVIDLRPATLEYEEGGGGFVSYEAGTYGGFTIAAGVVIENAIGGAGEDLMTGNTANNWLMGGLGDDEIDGGDGDDRISGGADDDSLTGGDGTDTLDYDDASAGVTVNMKLTTAQNTIGAGIDTVVGFENLIGSDHNDTLTGSHGVNEIDAGAGADTVYGMKGDDDLDGGDGNDIVNGGEGADVMRGGLGDDWLYVDNASDSIVEVAGQGAADRVLSGLSFTLDAAAEVEILSTLSVSSSTAINLTGNGFGQTIYGNAAINTLDGQDGADMLFGYGGADNLIGGGGNDSLDGGVGVDTAVGGLGDDTYTVDNASDVIVEVDGEGTADKVLSFVNYTLAAGVAVESLIAGSYSSTAAMNLTGNEFGQEIRGNQGANVLTGNGGADRLFGYNGVDTLTGGEGDDYIDGGAGIDTAAGGTGSDRYYVDNTADVVTELAGEGAGDRVLASTHYTLSASAEIEHLSTWDTASAGNINLTGNDFGQLIQGNAGANTLTGGGGADTLRGHNGDDILVGGTGNDTLTGGSGEDQYLFNAGSFGADTVTDFANGPDEIRFSGIAGVDDFSDLSISANGSGWAVITLPDGSTITLTGVTTGQVDASDFVFGP